MILSWVVVPSDGTETCAALILNPMGRIKRSCLGSLLVKLAPTKLKHETVSPLHVIRMLDEVQTDVGLVIILFQDF